MDATSITTEIQEIRNRLSEIEGTRRGLAEDDFATKADLLDEEHTLEARLAELRELAAETDSGLAEEEAADQTDLTGTPELPES